MVYAYDITITSTHTSTNSAKKYIQPYIHKVFGSTNQNNLTLYPDKTTCTPDPAEYTSILYLKITNTALPIATHPKVLGLYLQLYLQLYIHLRTKMHIHHTHSQHLSTHTQASTNNKSTHRKQDGVNSRRHSWLSTRQSWDRLWRMSLPYGRLFHPQPALINCKSCRTQH